LLGQLSAASISVSSLFVAVARLVCGKRKKKRFFMNYAKIYTALSKKAGKYTQNANGKASV
jgi:hypothetical protein